MMVVLGGILVISNWDNFNIFNSETSSDANTDNELDDINVKRIIVGLPEFEKTALNTYTVSDLAITILVPPSYKKSVVKITV